MTSDPTAARKGATYVHQGAFAVSHDPDEVLTTVLGSCVATCLYDADAGVGGMNHFLLPTGSDSEQGTRLYGVNLMELLINNLMRKGAQRRNIRAKLFGGGQLNGSVWDIGQRNAEFALKFMEDEGIPCIGQSLGGAGGRRVRFWPTSGRAQQNMLAGYEEKAAPPPPPAAPAAPSSGEVELF
ncbi:MAG: chemotaxis protein CheD [Pseudomonadota bacterium]